MMPKSDKAQPIGWMVQCQYNSDIWVDELQLEGDDEAEHSVHRFSVYAQPEAAYERARYLLKRYKRTTIRKVRVVEVLGFNYDETSLNPLQNGGYKTASRVPKETAIVVVAAD